MLIICEGEVTEPEYFALLRRMAIEGGIWAAIEIRPKPKEDRDQSSFIRSPHKSPRPKRKLILVAIPNEVDPIEEKYDIKSQPSCWVKEARDGLIDDTFEEVWAVFDRNGHASHEEAFLLATEQINGKQVNIAFSNVAFEHWILLHFEQNATAFNKAQCRQGTRVIECGTNVEPEDCQGANCAIGHLRVKNYLPPSESTKRQGISPNLLAQISDKNTRKTAYENAAWLRFIVPHNPAKPFLSNPYTNVDNLVQRLLGEEEEIIWGLFGQDISWKSLKIKTRIEGDKLIITITNVGKRTRILNDVDLNVTITDSTNQLIPTFNSSILDIGNPKALTIENLTNPSELRVQINSDSNARLIICPM